MAGNKQVAGLKGISLTTALELSSREIISLVGGGGKSTLMNALAKELEGAGNTVITTTTTRILPAQATGYLICENNEDLLFEKARQNLSKKHHLTLAGGRDGEYKLTSIGVDCVEKIASIASYIVIEADGAGCKPIKAPGRAEPVIPRATTIVIAVVGIDCLGKKVSEIVFRPEIACELIQIKPDDTVSTGMVASLILHPQGITKGSPPEARKVVFINKVNSDLELARAVEIAKVINKHSKFSHVIIGQAREKQPVIKVLKSGKHR